MSYRAIAADVNESLSLAGLSDFAERLYFRTVAGSDVWGRFAGDAKKVRASCIALVEDATEARVAAAIEELITAGRIELYCENGVWVCQVVDFDEHQPWEVRRRRQLRNARSRFPAKTPASIVTPMPPVTRARSRTRENGRTLDTSSVVQLHEQSSAAPTEQVQEIYDYWRTERGKTNRRYDEISAARRRKIVARLREFSADDLRTAIAAVALDPWPDRPRHDDIKIILRDREQVERFLELAERTPIETPEKDRRYTRA